MSIKLKLKDDVQPSWPDRVEHLRPFVAKSATGNGVKVVMRVDREYVFFTNSGCLIGISKLCYDSEGENERWLKANYVFLRYLGADESLTITGGPR